MLFFSSFDPSRGELHVELEKSENDEVKYFLREKTYHVGLKIRNRGVIRICVNHRIQNAKCQFFQKRNLFLNHDISIKTRVKFLNSFVRSRLTYACQNWALTQLQSKKLNSTYTNFLRKMVRNGFRRKTPNPDGSPNYSFHYSNDALYNICSTPELSTFIEKSQTKYCAHIIRQENSSLCKALMFNADKYTKRGKPNPTLLSQVQKYNPNMSPSEFYAKSLQRCF